MKHQKLKTTPEVSKRMKALSHKKSKVESLLAKALWHKGYHYRLNYKKLPGTPDIALTKYKIALLMANFGMEKILKKQRINLRIIKIIGLKRLRKTFKETLKMIIF